MNSKLTSTQEVLANYMSEISERCYSASWMKNLEYVLWDALTNGPRNYGHGLITKKDIQMLKKLSLMINGWVMFDDLSEETAIEKKLWEIKFSETIINDPNILKG